MTTSEKMEILKIKPYLTVKEASSYFGIGENRIADMLRDSECDFVLRVGIKKLVKKDKLAHYLESIKQI